MAEAIDVSAETARRFVLGKHGLWPARRWSGKDGARTAMRAIEHLQLDPVVIVARSHDLILHSRVANYRPEYFDELTYKDREFFDWGGWLAVRPMDELPYWRVLMRRNAHHGRIKQIGEQHSEAIRLMRARLAAGERISSRELDSDDKLPTRDYRGGKEAALALYYLWRVGDAMTFERRGFERVYAATEFVAPPGLLKPAGEREAELFIARKAIAHDGITKLPSLYPLFSRKMPRSEGMALENELLDRGDIARVRVAAWPPGQFIVSADVPLLEAVARGELPAEWAPGAEECTLLSPLDPIVARGRSAELFGFEHIWEIYKKAEDVKFGRYTMPILWDDALVARVDLRTDRATGALVVNGLWFEQPGLARDDQMTAALVAEISRLAVFVGATTIDARELTQRSIRARLGSALTSRPSH
jgi:uncharacterized protein YcaQ